RSPATQTSPTTVSGLLRARRERPCCRAAEQRDEITPFHCPVPPVLLSKRNTTRGTAALRDFILCRQRVIRVASACPRCSRHYTTLTTIVRAMHGRGTASKTGTPDSAISMHKAG